MKYLFILSLAVIFGNCSPKLSPDAGWSRQRWILTEMKGVPVQLSGGRKDAYLSFETGEKRFTGNAGCNQVNGNYSLDKNDIHFTEIITTKMSCEDIAFENTFLDLLKRVDRFEQKGSELLLKRKREVLLVLSSR